MSLSFILFPLLLLFCFESYQPCYIFLLKGLTDNAIKNLAFCCRLLRTLNLAGCSKVTIQCVAILPSMIQWFVCLVTSCLDNKFSCFTCPPILCKLRLSFVLYEDTFAVWNGVVLISVQSRSSNCL